MQPSINAIILEYLNTFIVPLPLPSHNYIIATDNMVSLANQIIIMVENITEYSWHVNY